jgi:hypothetical protein
VPLVEQELLTILEHLRSPPVTRLVPLVEQELLTLLEHLRSPPVTRLVPLVALLPEVNVDVPEG